MAPDERYGFTGPGRDIATGSPQVER